MIASLPMYDRPETQAANDRFWRLLRDGLQARGMAAPDALTRDGRLWDHWRAPDLVLSQTCGLPFRAVLHGSVTLVATPDYGVEGCDPGHYRSVLVCRAEDPRLDLAAFDGASLAYNEPMSQSGWAAPAGLALAAGLRWCPVGPTGAHRLSALAVAERRADLAAIDAVTWRMLRRWDSWSSVLRVLAATDPTPGLPLIAAAGADPEPLRAALDDALAALGPDDRDVLQLRGFAAIPVADYLAVPIPAPPPSPDMRV